MAQLAYHPAPGLGDLLPGFFVVPQNPITAAAYGVTKVQGIGEILPGAFSVPQNPLKSAVGLAGGGCGCGGGSPCGGGCGGGSGLGKVNGVGVAGVSEDWNTFTSTISQGNIVDAAQLSILGFPVWGWLAALVAVPVVLSSMGGGGGAPAYGRGRR